MQSFNPCANYQMIKIWLKHTIAETALERFFDSIFNNFDVVDEDVTVMLLSDVDESFHGKRIYKAFFDGNMHVCGEFLKKSHTRLISMWIIDSNHIGICYTVDDEHMHSEGCWVNEAQIYLKE